MPFNYPISQLPHKIVAPLLMGNSVILKPASETPLSGIRFVELMWEAGFPGNAIQVLTGSGARIGRQLCLDPRVSAVSLTGSTEVGIEIAKTAATHLHHVKLELGGNDPLIILEDADLDLAVEESIAGRSVQNAGQACCASKRFIVSNKIKDAYVEKLVARLRALKTGDPADPETDFGPVISAKAAKVALQQVQDAISSGARLLLGGACANDTFVELTVLDVTRDMAIARDEEVFAPVWPIIGFDTVEEAVSIANDTKYGLSSGVIGKDMKQLLQVARTIQAGACIINGSGDYRSYDQPFGGYKMTGLGREGSRHTLESVTQLKTIIFKGCF
jgi:succinate-semialdehyde dehydrogenase/glutarate-semialdehyde dehydrogenase